MDYLMKPLLGGAIGIYRETKLTPCGLSPLHHEEYWSAGDPHDLGRVSLSPMFHLKPTHRAPMHHDSASPFRQAA
jgi:hypothetical protein